MTKIQTAIPIVLILALTALPGLAQSSGPAPTPAPIPVAPDPSFQSYGDNDKTCLSWTDTCRTCARAADGAIACSNIGIACQPTAIVCSVRQPAPAK